MRKTILLAALACVGMHPLHAQTDSLMSLLEEGEKNKKEPIEYTFKATRLVNNSTIETLGDGVLDMRISHRFGQVKQGIENFFGIDNATTRIGLDYGITKNIMVGLGHSVLDKENDGFVKVRLLRQYKNGTPITLSYYGSMSVMTKDAPKLNAGQEWQFSNRLTFVNQLLIARKFNDRLSLQLMPTLLHLNLVDSNKFDNNIFALGVGGRVRLSRRVSFTGEYFYRFTGQNNYVNGTNNKTYNSLSLGFDVETGGHVFQMFVTNSFGNTERAMLAQTTDRWEKGEVHYGFNISRVFTLKKPKEFRKKGGESW